MTSLVSEENAITALASRFINHTNRNIFLTGKAGTGKTTFLKYITRSTHKNTIIAAPTGIAAINAGGVTLHSLFHLPFGAFIPERSSFSEHHLNQKFNNAESMMKNMRFNTTKRKLLRELELLIIDEVSMLRSDLLDAVDTVLRSMRRNPTPFGGVQVLFIGDLQQLPPVVKDDEWRVLRDHYSSPFFFDAQVLRHSQPLYIELEKIYRQHDNTFISVLNNLRNNEISEHDIELLNNYYKPGFKPDEGENYIYLTTHNYKADKVNKEELQKLEGKIYSYKAETTGDFSEYAYPVELVLELKKGAQVMFIKNDPSGEQRFFNGKIGKIKYLGSEEIEVEFDDDSLPVSVEKYQWENVKYKLNEATSEIEENVAGTFTHYPLKLAWAITVHKSQGLTFEKAIIDTGSAFAPGQVYVALSRLTSLEGLVLSSPINYRSIKNDGSVAEFSQVKHAQDPLEVQLEYESNEYMNDFLLQCFNLKELHNKLRWHAESYSKDEKRSNKQKYVEWAKQLQENILPHLSTTEKFVHQLRKIFASQPVDLQLLHSRVTSAMEYFTPVFKSFSENVLEHIEEVKKDTKIKAYITELKDLELLFFKQMQQIKKAEALVRSAVENTEFTGEGIMDEQEKKEREEKAAEIKSAKKRSGGEKKGKKPKGFSQQESYRLYTEGKTIPEIAAERGMAVTTIEGHIAHFVQAGNVKPEAFVPADKLKNIYAVLKDMDTTALTPIKQKMGEDYTYSEIRFAVAAYIGEKERM